MLYRSILGLVFISLVFTIPVEARQGQSAAKPSKNLVSRAKSKQGQTSASRRNRSQLSSKKARSKARVRRANGFPVAAHKVRRDKAEIHSALEESDRENRSVKRATKHKVRQQVQDHIGRDRGVFQVAPTEAASNAPVATTPDAPRDTAGHWDSGPSATVSGMENFDKEIQDAEAGLPAEDPLGF